MTIKWTSDAEGNLYYMHYTDEMEDPKEDKNMMIRHCFLEVLDLLKILEYNRGYDGLYYDIVLKRK